MKEKRQGNDLYLVPLCCSNVRQPHSSVARGRLHLQGNGVMTVMSRESEDLHDMPLKHQFVVR